MLQLTLTCEEKLRYTFEFVARPCCSSRVYMTKIYSIDRSLVSTAVCVTVLKMHEIILVSHNPMALNQQRCQSDNPRENLLIV